MHRAWPHALRRVQLGWCCGRAWLRRLETASSHSVMPEFTTRVDCLSPRHSKGINQPPRLEPLQVRSDDTAKRERKYNYPIFLPTKQDKQHVSCCNHHYHLYSNCTKKQHLPTRWILRMWEKANREKILNLFKCFSSRIITTIPILGAATLYHVNPA